MRKEDKGLFFSEAMTIKGYLRAQPDHYPVRITSVPGRRTWVCADKKAFDDVYDELEAYIAKRRKCRKQCLLKVEKHV